MPRNVRNFWLTLDVDGKQTPVATGPRSKDGGFNLTILVRDKGSIADKSVNLRGFINSHGEIIVECDGPSGPLLLSATER